MLQSGWCSVHLIHSLMQPLHKAVVLCCSFNPKRSLFFSFFPLCFPADCYGHAATMDLMNDTLLPPGTWTILVSLQNKFNLHFLERKRSVFLRERGAMLFIVSWAWQKLVFWGSDKRSVFGGVALWKQQAKLTELQHLWRIFFFLFYC